MRPFFLSILLLVVFSRCETAQRKVDADLLQAVLQGDLKTTKNIYAAGRNVNAPLKGYTAIHYAALSGQNQILQYLIDRGANIEADDGKGNTPVMWAGGNNHLETVKLLYKKGANLKKTNNFGNNILHRASRSGAKLALIQFLSDKVDYRLKGENGNPLDTLYVNCMFFAVEGLDKNAVAKELAKCKKIAKYYRSLGLNSVHAKFKLGGKDVESTKAR